MTSIFSFKGIADRTDWWITMILVGLVAELSIIFSFSALYDENGANWFVFSALTLLAGLSIWSAFAVTAKRFREHGDSPWMCILLLVPGIGGMIVCIICGFLSNPIKKKNKVALKMISFNPIKKRPD